MQEPLEGLGASRAEPPKRIVIPHGYRRGRCRGCRAVIFWVTKVDADGVVKTSRKTGRPIMDPIDPWPVSTGEVVLRGAGRAENVPITVFHDGERWQSHFRSCPESRQFSGRSRRRPGERS
jgi:hypothetical protein